MKVIYDNDPSVLEAVGNGSHRYHYDINAVKAESTGKSSGTESKTQYECQEVIVWEPLTSNKITEAVIADKWDGNQEQKLINEYNAIQLGITTDKAEIAIKTAAYKEFLAERIRLKAIVDADCKTLGIE
nr:MAG TPA: hypothetical protein [Caudoviricetes sp.]